MILFFFLLFRLSKVNEETHTDQGNQQDDDTGDNTYHGGDFTRRWTHYDVRRIYECITPMIWEFSFVFGQLTVFREGKQDRLTNAFRIRIQIIAVIPLGTADNVPVSFIAIAHQPYEEEIIENASTMMWNEIDCLLGKSKRMWHTQQWRECCCLANLTSNFRNRSDRDFWEYTFVYSLHTFHRRYIDM